MLSPPANKSKGPPRYPSLETHMKLNMIASTPLPHARGRPWGGAPPAARRSGWTGTQRSSCARTAPARRTTAACPGRSGSAGRPRSPCTWSCSGWSLCAAGPCRSAASAALSCRPPRATAAAAGWPPPRAGRLRARAGHHLPAPELRAHAHTGAAAVHAVMTRLAPVTGRPSPRRAACTACGCQHTCRRRLSVFMWMGLGVGPREQVNPKQTLYEKWACARPHGTRRTVRSAARPRAPATGGRRRTAARPPRAARARR
jgi:hypothetical protein